MNLLSLRREYLRIAVRFKGTGRVFHRRGQACPFGQHDKAGYHGRADAPCRRKLSLEEKIKITQEMRTGGDGVLKELEPGHEFSLREILTLMIIVSDNEATNILIQMLGMDRINRMAAELGLKEAVLGRKMMDSEAKTGP